MKQNNNKTCGFSWEGKSGAAAEVKLPANKIFRPVKEDSKDWDTTENVYIEGDNLDALKLLQENYHGKIKMCYIDPPYNTGNDFIYHDDFTHWCGMMYPRLALARNLLTPDGVIFISIDDRELARLRMICDEIFGENNFIGILSVENNPKGRKNSSFISVSSEYCVIFAKQKENARFIENIPKKACDMALDEDEDGKFVHNSGKRVLVGENCFNKRVTKKDSEKNYSVYYRANDRQLQVVKEDYGEINGCFIAEGYVKYYSHNNGKLIENTYTESKFCELFEKRALKFSNNKIYEKNFSDTVRIKSQLSNRRYEAIVKGKKQNYSMELTTTGAGTYIKDLFGVTESPFSSPKNIGFLKLLISLFENEPFTILDFFSGSATTADAVMRLNAENNGKRKFIMVQLPENLDDNLKKANNAAAKRTIQSAISICDKLNKPRLLSEIGKERIRLAGEKIKKETGADIDTGYRVFKLAETE